VCNCLLREACGLVTPETDPAHHVERSPAMCSDDDNAHLSYAQAKSHELVIDGKTCDSCMVNISEPPVQQGIADRCRWAQTCCTSAAADHPYMLSMFQLRFTHKHMASRQTSGELMNALYDIQHCRNQLCESNVPS